MLSTKKNHRNAGGKHFGHFGYLSNDVLWTAPPKVTSWFRLTGWLKHKDAIDMLVDSFQRFTAIVETPAQVFASKLYQQTKALQV